ncbi:MAG: hypothetical protein C0402_14545 [Thermodesulfovibrio sp.]|nr:hypothetical protein [Thermodesulfovibrio sp.]
MDIAKIRKKAKAEGQRQDRALDSGQETMHETPGPDQTEGSGPAVQPSGGMAAEGPAQPAEKAETPSGTYAVTAGDRHQAEPGVPAAAEPPVQSPRVPDPLVPGGNAIAVREDSGIAELLTFSLAKEEFAFKVSEVEEIIRFQRITLVPTMPEYVAGITSLRGKIIPVIDLRTRLALKDEGAEAVSRPEADADGLIEGKGKIIVLSGPLGLIGAIIDKVLGVVRLPEDVILEPPAHLTEDETKFIEGVVIVEKRFISIIRSEDALNIEVD